MPSAHSTTVCYTGCRPRSCPSSKPNPPEKRCHAHLIRGAHQPEQPSLSPAMPEALGKLNSSCGLKPGRDHLNLPIRVNMLLALDRYAPRAHARRKRYGSPDRRSNGNVYLIVRHFERSQIEVNDIALTQLSGERSERQHHGREKLLLRPTKCLLFQNIVRPPAVAISKLEASLYPPMSPPSDASILRNTTSIAI